MRRRLDLAASLIGRPPILFLDEPTSGARSAARETTFGRSSMSWWQRGRTVLLTTRRMEEAEHLAHRIVVLDDGRVVAHGTADELKDRLGGNVLQVRVKNRTDLERACSLVAGSEAQRLGSTPIRTRSASRSKAEPSCSSPPDGRSTTTESLWRTWVSDGRHSMTCSSR